jgi:hypothetical protein
METVLNDVDQQLCELVKKLQGRVRAPIEGDPVEVGRLRVILSLYDLATCFDAIGAGQDVANHFAVLGTMFHDLNEGARPPPLFVPASSRGNRPEVSLLGKLRGSVALGVDILIRSGMTEKEAVTTAATMYPGLNQLLTKNGAHLKSSIEVWYKKAKQADSGGAEVNLQMLQAFKLRDDWEGVPPGSACEHAGRYILKHTEAMAKSLPSFRLPEKA